MENLKIEYLPIESLKPYEKNARRHEEADVQTIVNSIREFGFDDPIGVWGDENLIVEGHGRLLAAKQLGMDKVPCIRLDHLTDEQRRAYALAHNKTAEMSSWLDGILKNELDDITDIDMSDFGFDLFDDEPPEIKDVELQPFTKVYYLVSLDVNDNDKVVDMISKIREIAGVEVESTLN